jgi:hypothetical protein
MMMTETTAALHIDTTPTAGLAQLTEDEIDAVGGGLELMGFLRAAAALISAATPIQIRIN